MILDSSALLAVIYDEPGASRLLDILLTARDLHISAGTLIEAQLVAERRGLKPHLDGLISRVGVEIIPVDVRQVELAHEGFLRFGKGRHPAGLNFGDLFAYALARALDEPLLYVGTDFGLTDVRSAVR